MLKHFCKQHGIDEQELDSNLTYTENMMHLQTFILETPKQALERRAADFKALVDQYQNLLSKEYAEHYKSTAPIIQVVAYVSRFIRRQAQIQAEAHPFNLALLHHYLIFRGTAHELNTWLNQTHLPIRIVETRILNPEVVVFEPLPPAEPIKRKTDIKLLSAFKGDHAIRARETWRTKKDPLDKMGWQFHKWNYFDYVCLKAISKH